MVGAVRGPGFFGSGKRFRGPRRVGGGSGARCDEVAVCIRVLVRSFWI